MVYTSKTLLRKLTTAYCIHFGISCSFRRMEKPVRYFHYAIRINLVRINAGRQTRRSEISEN